MFKEYDIVESVKNINHLVQSGTKGTILMVYGPNPTHYEVEFFDDEGNSVAVLTVAADDMKKRKQ